MVSVIGRLRARTGRETELEGVLRDLAQLVASQEPDCQLYQANRSKHDPQLYLLIECYTDDEALRAHANAPHFRDRLTSLMDCLEEPPELALFDEL